MINNIVFRGFFVGNACLQGLNSALMLGALARRLPIPRVSRRLRNAVSVGVGVGMQLGIVLSLRHVPLRMVMVSNCYTMLSSTLMILNTTRRDELARSEGEGKSIVVRSAVVPDDGLRIVLGVGLDGGSVLVVQPQ